MITADETHAATGDDCKICVAGQSLESGDPIVVVDGDSLCAECARQCLHGDHDLTDDAVEAVRAELGDEVAA